MKNVMPAGPLRGLPLWLASAGELYACLQGHDLTRRQAVALVREIVRRDPAWPCRCAWCRRARRSRSHPKCAYGGL
jgi:hypothetical protein